MAINIQVFNQNQIKGWNTAIEELRVDIATSEQKSIPDHNLKIAQLTPLFERYESAYNQEVANYQTKKQPFELEKKQIESQISVYNSLISNENDRIEALKRSIEHTRSYISSLETSYAIHRIGDAFNKDNSLGHQLLDTIDHVGRRWEIKAQKNKINGYEAQINQHRQLISMYQSSINQLIPHLTQINTQLASFFQELNSHQATINYRHQQRLIQDEERAIANEQLTNQAKREQIKAIEKHIQSAEQFLQELKNQPKEMFEKLSHNLLQDLHRYEEKQNIDHADDNLHIVSLELPQKIALIENTALELKDENEGANAAINEWHVKYACLCGYLWNLHNRFKPTFLSKMIGTALESTHIAENGALPDDLARGSCASIFAEFQCQEPNNARDFTIADVHAQYNTVRDELLKELRSKLQNNDCTPAEKTFYQHCKAVVTAAEAERFSSGAQFNNPFYTKILQQTRAVMKNPTHLDTLHKYERLAHSEKVDGQRSCCKLVCGAMLALAGVVLTTLSTLALIFSVGISSPVSIPLICVGTSMIISGSVLFKKGMRTGTVDSMFAVTKNAVKQTERSEAANQDGKDSYRPLPAMTTI